MGPNGIYVYYIDFFFHLDHLFGTFHLLSYQALYLLFKIELPPPTAVQAGIHIQHTQLLDLISGLAQHFIMDDI